MNTENTTIPTTSIVFENTTPIDPRAWSVMGLSAKETDNPVGFFGTGLKYAIAIVLREGCELTIHSAGQTYRFHSAEATFRDKIYQQVYCNDTMLPFTTDLGQHWQLWQAFRELYCNALDEGGTVRELPTAKVSPHDGTLVQVTGAPFSTVYQQRDRYFISHHRKPLATTPYGEIYSGSGIYLRGVRVTDDSFRSSYAYNLQRLPLNEDRLVTLGFGTIDTITHCIVASKNHAIIRATMEASGRVNGDTKLFETHLYWSHYAYDQDLLEVAREYSKQYPEDVNSTIRDIIKANTPDDSQYDHFTPTPEQLKKVTSAINRLAHLNYPVCAEITYVTISNPLLMAFTTSGKIYLTNFGIEQTLDNLTATLFEESEYHIKHGFRDLARNGQSWLISELLVNAARAEDKASDTLS